LTVALEKKRFSNPIVGSGMQQARKVSAESIEVQRKHEGVA